VAARSPAADTTAEAKKVLDLAGRKQGLCIHLGAGGESAGLTAALAAGSEMLVHALTPDDASAERATKAIEAAGLAGRARAEKADLPPLPFVPHLANLVVVDDFAPLAKAGLKMAEVLRVVAPGGVVCVRQAGEWTKTVQPRPETMADWTHPSGDAGGSWVSDDKAARFPAGLRWLDGVPMNFNRWASCRAWVAADGKVFTLSTTEVENISPAGFVKHKRHRWVTARDAYNGLPLWKVNCEGDNDGRSLNHANTGALVTDGRRVYAHRNGRLVGLDINTGKQVVSCPVKFPTVRLLVSDGTIVAAGWEGKVGKGIWDPWRVKTDAGAVEAFDAETGKPRWSVARPAQHLLAADGNAYMLCQAPTRRRARRSSPSRSRPASSAGARHTAASANRPTCRWASPAWAC